jgi:hypothetical protein
MPPNKVTKGKETNLWWKMHWPKKVSTGSPPRIILWVTLNISPVHFSSYSLVNIFRIYVILTLSPTLKRKGFRIVLLLLSVGIAERRCTGR